MILEVKVQEVLALRCYATVAALTGKRKEEIGVEASTSKRRE